ncbi:MAG: hypothetical protein ABIG67_05845 [Pseudomonadota bacterium]
MAEKTRVMQCRCEHEYQDRVYGKGMRLFNNAPAKGAHPNRYRCTVCGQEREG